MENNRNTEVFSYTYNAKEQEEIKRIREKYQPPEEDKMALLRRLDASVTKKGTVVSLILGIISCLVMGTGMAMVLEFGSQWFLPGLIIGIVGIIGVILAYPLYLLITEKERERLAPTILRLTDELMQ